MSRYQRQIQLPEIGADGQEQLAAAHAVVIGAGGLGAPVLQYLVGAGVGKITVVDDDHIAQSNLHRQTLFRETDVGKPKAQAAAATLAGLNPDCEIIAVQCALSCDNVQTLLRDATVVLDCADSFAASYILSDHCFTEGIPLFSASVLAFAGYAGGFCGGTPSLRAVFPDLPTQAASCESAGVLGPVVGMIGSLQATMALNYLLGLSPSPLGQLVQFDAKTYRTSGFRFDGAPEPEGPKLCFIAPSMIAPGDMLVDLRGVEEAPNLFHPSAKRILPENITTIPHPIETRVVLACRSGLRAWRAAKTLRENGHQNLALVALGTTDPKTEN
ncbi:HesA/MoeB/ThiF family protein [Halocynthiibacter sp. C4]|uniref:HesA/MoeB/ThiF family protein n=1 Tax=Halocynthiibacter sp. C4 TaxID=2992758 RepID=UPI00237BFBB8|nr:HesA/MoeB/ThiF family protein [Halocynthiibacter sp. C4]MDE0590595.1 HesA/MoeB/ThiF family protein [Halocynthiibacter sp. C4]